MLQLALILLTVELPEGFKLSQPGTVSKATRLMNRYSSQYGKTGFPEDTDTYAIEDYIGPDSKLVVLRHEIFRKPGVRLMASAQADLTEVCEVVEQMSSSD